MKADEIRNIPAGVTAEAHFLREIAALLAEIRDLLDSRLDSRLGDA